MEARTRAEAESLGRAATIGMLVLLLLAYRRLGSLVLTPLPLASAALAGLAAVSALFGYVHGITLAFGFTLIGVAQDYPIHLLEPPSPGRLRRASRAPLWPTLATGVASTCVAYADLPVQRRARPRAARGFTVAGLAVAGLTTRYLLPTLDRREPRDYGDSRVLGASRARSGTCRARYGPAGGPRRRRARRSSLAPQPFWENDLSGLTPVPADLLAHDRELRAELGTADLRYLLVVGAADERRRARQPRSARPALTQSVAAAPSAATTTPRATFRPAPSSGRAKPRLPDAATLRADFEAAQAQTPFRPAAFEPFLDDVERARDSPPLTIEQIRATALGTQTRHVARARRTAPYGARDPERRRDVAALRALARSAGARHTARPERRLRVAGGAAAHAHALELAVGPCCSSPWSPFALRDRPRVSRVIAPMALTTLVVVAVLQAAGISLNLFHLISLILAAGLGLDYALFFEHAADDAAEQARTLHATLVCALSTLLVFVLLATSSLPVLRAIGTPVAIGVVANFVLALLLTRPQAV